MPTPTGPAADPLSAATETAVVPLSVEAPPAAPAPSLRQTATRGILWMAGQTFAIKAIGFGANIVLAWLLLRTDFGLLGLCSTVYAVVAVFFQTGIQQILVKRQKHFRRWQPAATWLSICLGVAGVAATAVLAPVAAMVYGEPAIVPLLLVQCLALPAYSLNAVALARLQMNLQFRSIATISVYASLLTTAVSITLALLKFGPYSIAIAQVFSAVFTLACCWTTARLRIPRRMHVRRWRYLVGDGWWITGTNLLTTVVSQGDYFILGLTQSTEVVGVYYFAYNLSTQAMQLVTVNLANVLLPMLSKFSPNDPNQVARYIDASEVMAYFGVPLCVLQALLARPLLEFVYGHRWDAAIVPLQLLSLAMIPVIIGGHAGTLLQAQGRFKAGFQFVAVSAVVFLVVIYTATQFGAAAAVAGGVIVAYAILSAMGLLWAVRPTVHNVKRLAALSVQPTVIGLAAGAVALFVGQLVAGHSRFYNATYGLVVLIVFPALYLGTVRVFRKRIWGAISERISLR